MIHQIVSSLLFSATLAHEMARTGPQVVPIYDTVVARVQPPGSKRCRHRDASSLDRGIRERIRAAQKLLEQREAGTIRQLKEEGFPYLFDPAIARGAAASAGISEAEDEELETVVVRLLSSVLARLPEEAPRRLRQRPDADFRAAVVDRMTALSNRGDWHTEYLPALDNFIISSRANQSEVTPGQAMLFASQLLPCVEAKEDYGVNVAHQNTRPLLFGKKPFYQESTGELVISGDRYDPIRNSRGSPSARSFAAVSASEPFETNDNLFRLQWYLGGPENGQEFGSNFLSAWQLLAEANGQTMDAAANSTALFGGGFPVAVIDTGCALSADNTIESGSHSLTNENVTMDKENHGTGTSALIGAGWNNLHGIASPCPFCTVTCIKVFDDERNVMTGAALLRATQYLLENHDKFLISNHSYGGPGLSDYEREAFDKLSDLGHLAITAAGNDACDIDEMTEDACNYQEGKMIPATLGTPNLITAASIDVDGNISEFSNWGQTSVELFAPGERIVTLSSDEDKAVAQSGTSFAAPLVTSAAALMYRDMEICNYHATAQEVKQAIIASARPSPKLQKACTTGAILDAKRAIEALRKIKGVTNC